MPTTTIRPRRQLATMLSLAAAGSVAVCALPAHAAPDGLAKDAVLLRSSTGTPPDFAAITRQFGAAVVNISVNGVRHLAAAARRTSPS